MKVLRPVRYNRGVTTRFSNEVEALIDRMSASYIIELSYIYSQNPATKSDAVDNIDQKLREQKQIWDEIFWAFIFRYVFDFVNKIYNTSDNSFKSALSDGGLVLGSSSTPMRNTVLKALEMENEKLFKSIHDQYHEKAEAVVMRNFSMGKSMDVMQDEIRGLLAKTKARGHLITTDQANKISSAIVRVRMNELGLTKAVWDHGSAYRHEPRHSHVVSTGTMFDIREGCLIDGEYIQPAEKINCKCVYKAVLPY